jgi:hypothetical protein
MKTEGNWVYNQVLLTYMNVALLSEALKDLSAKLESRDILLSDAILKALRIFRIFYTDEKLGLFNRELLGYLQEEMQDIEDSRVKHEQGFVFPKQVVAYRYLTGFWVSESILKRGVKTIACLQSERIPLFCNYGVGELELLLARLNVDEETYIGIKLVPNSKEVFLCRASQLYRMYSAIRQVIKNRIDELILEMGT